jgi:CubicO group peptidase (beta-lactamase class C family)
VTVRKSLAFKRIGLALALLLNCGAAQAQGQHEDAPDDAAIEAFVDAHMREGMASSHVAGAVVAVVRDDRVVLLRGYGQADTEGNVAVDPENTLFRIGSVSKTFTWLSLLKMAERGELALDADVNAYLPPRAHVRYNRFAGPVRVLDLMAHAAGFDDNESYLFAMSPDRILSLEQYLSIHREPLVRAPRTFSSYSNYGAALAGLIAVRRSGAPDFPTLVEREILTPAGMHSTTFREFYPPRADLPAPMRAQLHADTSLGYVWNGANFIAQRKEYITAGGPAGSGYSTGADMARYMRAILGGGTIDGVQVYGPGVAQKLREPVLVGADAEDGWRHGFLPLHYPGDREVIGHNGATLFFRSNMILVPSLKLGVFVAANTDTANDLTESLAPALVAQVFPSEDPPANLRTHKRDLRPFVGTYRASRRAHSGMARFIRLLQSEVTVRDIGGGRLVVDAGEVREFVDEGTDRFRAADVRVHGKESLLFLRDAQGRAGTIIPSHNAVAFERTPFWETTATLFAALGVFAAGILGATIMLFVRFGNRGAARDVLTHRAVVLAGGVIVAGIGFFFVWVSKTENVTYLIEYWPGLWLDSAKWAWRTGLVLALVAVGLSVERMVAPGGSFRWRPVQRIACVLAALSALAFVLLLLTWGALG